MDNELHKSILSGDIATIQKLIANGASVNKLHGIKATPLCASITSNKLDIVKFLLETKSCDVNGVDYDGEPPLCLAIRKGFNDTAKVLIHTEGCNLNVVDSVTKRTPLCWAVCEGNAEIVEFLVKNGCDIDKPAERGNTALHYAITDSRLDIVKLLLAGNASLLKYNNNGHHILHHSIYREELNCSKLLLQHLEKQPKDIREDVIDALTQIHSDSCLHLAIEVGSLALLELLLKYQTKIDVANTVGHSSLYLAVKKNSIELVSCLLKAGADPNVACHDTVNRHYQVQIRTSSMLHAGVITGNLNLVRMLLEHGASPNSLDFRGNNPLAVALNRNKPTIARYLLENCDIDVTAENDRHESCLFAALSCSNPAWFVEELVKRGCSVNQPNKDKQTPLQMAADFECTEVIEVLLDNGCDVNDVDEFGKSVLHVASMNGCTDTVRMLLFYGADFEAEDNDFQTPLSLAFESENYDIGQILLECGATVHQPLAYNGIDNVNNYMCAVLPKYLHEHFLQLMEINYPVPKLSEFCRKTLRKHFMDHNISPKLLSLLSLPERMVRYLAFRS